MKRFVYTNNWIRIYVRIIRRPDPKILSRILYINMYIYTYVKLTSKRTVLPYYLLFIRTSVNSSFTQRLYARIEHELSQRSWSEEIATDRLSLKIVQRWRPVLWYREHRLDKVFCGWQGSLKQHRRKDIRIWHFYLVYTRAIWWCIGLHISFLANKVSGRVLSSSRGEPQKQLGHLYRSMPLNKSGYQGYRRFSSVRIVFTA